MLKFPIFFKSNVIFPPLINLLKTITPVNSIHQYYSIRINSEWNRCLILSHDGCTNYGRDIFYRIYLMWKIRFNLKGLTKNQILAEYDVIDNFLKNIQILLTFTNKDIKSTALRGIDYSEFSIPRHLVNYIRHQLTNYDYIRRTSVHNFTQRAYFSHILKIKCLEKMQGRYGYDDEISRQIEKNQTKIKYIKSLIKDDCYM